MTSSGRNFAFWIISSLLLTSSVCSGDFSQKGGRKKSERGAARNWEERCLKVGGEEVLSLYVREQEQLLWCLMKNVNLGHIQEEVESHKKTGDLDGVFMNYCRNEIPVIRGCISRFLLVSQSCLVPSERPGLNTTMAMVEGGLSYLCHHQGDRLALFMASKGLECLLNHREEVLQCVHKADREARRDRERPRMHFYVFQKENCRKGDAIISCVETSLLKCKDPTPANLVDGLLHAMKAETPCPSSAPLTFTLPFLASLSLLASLLRAHVL